MEIENRGTITAWYSIEESPVGYKYFCKNGNPAPNQHEPLIEAFTDIIATLHQIELDLR
jgi:hypothetical protein